MRKWIAGGIAVVALAGCSPSEPESSPEVASTSAVVTPAPYDKKPASAPPRASATPQPISPAAIGEAVGSPSFATWTVTNIAVDGPCPDDYASALENGHMLVIDLDVTTGPEFKESTFPDFLSPYKGAWTIVGADGVTETSITSPASYGCADRDFPDFMNADSRYQFAVAFDTRNASGDVTYELRAGTSRVGWTWSY